MMSQWLATTTMSCVGIVHTLQYLIWVEGGPKNMISWDGGVGYKNRLMGFFPGKCDPPGINNGHPLNDLRKPFYT